MQEKILNESERINACDEDVRTVTDNFQLTPIKKKTYCRSASLQAEAVDNQTLTGRLVKLFTHTPALTATGGK